MKHIEQAFFFDCAGDQLLGVVSHPDHGALPKVGMLIIVGGPQYRVGSHRLFVRVARHAAAHGLAAMRFDYRGMGDATGELRNFESVNDDIRAAVNAFQRQVPSLQRIVLWGLCDGASAACMYAPQDPRIHGVILLNPWVNTIEGSAQAKLRHYYLKRLFSAALWRKLLTGQMPRVLPFLAQLRTLMVARLQRLLITRPDTASPRHPDNDALPQRTGRLLARSGVPVGVMLSDDDKVAREFEAQALPTAEWQKVQRDQWLGLLHLDPADHTVTSAEARQRLCEQTVAWIKQIAAR
jgi:exosortase A-associated hydrolase 1